MATIDAEIFKTLAKLELHQERSNKLLGAILRELRSQNDGDDEDGDGEDEDGEDEDEGDEQVRSVLGALGRKVVTGLKGNGKVPVSPKEKTAPAKE